MADAQDETAAAGGGGRHTLVAGDVGEVDFDFVGGALTLVEVRPGQGWEFSVRR